MNKIDTIRYMGTKSGLLEFIIPEITKITPNNGFVLDLMAGSNAVSYALKPYFTVYTNDVQMYSKIISEAIIVNQSETISSSSATCELEANYQHNIANKDFSFFEQIYSNTYFSKKQCIDIDALRYAIDFIDNKYRKSLYLLALMATMCKVQSTPGHFAQYMPSNHKRIIPLQQMDVLEEFYKKCDLYSSIVFTPMQNKAFCMDYRNLLSEKHISHVDTIYLDAPYSQEQYSRFYHILETIVKYDSPTVHFKAKYRDDRFMSSFCYKDRVEKEFTNIFNYCKTNSINLVLSYSNRGLIPSEKLYDLANKYFHVVNMKTFDYKHSTQGKGSNPIKEILISCH